MDDSKQARREKMRQKKRQRFESQRQARHDQLVRVVAATPLEMLPNWQRVSPHNRQALSRAGVTTVGELFERYDDTEFRKTLSYHKLFFWLFEKDIGHLGVVVEETISYRLVLSKKNEY